MKILIFSLIFLGASVASRGQTSVPARSIQGNAQSNGILRAVENGDMQSVGDHYVVTRKDNHLPISLIFKSCQGVGVNRESNQSWILPINAAGSQIEV